MEKPGIGSRRIAAGAAGAAGVAEAEGAAALVGESARLTLLDKKPVSSSAKKKERVTRFVRYEPQYPFPGPILALLQEKVTSQKALSPMCLQQEREIQAFLRKKKENYNRFVENRLPVTALWNTKTMDSPSRRLAFNILERIKNQELHRAYVTALREMKCPWVDETLSVSIKK